MGKRLQMKKFHRVPLARRLGHGALSCVIFVALIAAPHISHAARGRHPIPTQSVSVAKPGRSDASANDRTTSGLIALSGFLAIGAFYLGKANSKAKKALTKAIRELETECDNQRREFEGASEKRAALQERLEREQRVLAARDAELGRAYQDIMKLRNRLAEMLQVDPGIEKKALDAARERAKAEAAIAAQKKIEAEGRAKLDDLLTQMKRG